jgi:hypothetical protein
MRPQMMVSLRVTSSKKVSRYITGVLSQGFADKEIQDSANHWKITCSIFWENTELHPCGYPGTKQLCSLCGDNEEAEGMDCRNGSVKREKYFLQHHIARHHTSIPVKDAIREFRWTVLQHPPHSPALTSSNFHL